MGARAATTAALILSLVPISLAAQRRVPRDLSGVRGFDYQSATARGTADLWLNYSEAETERDLDYAVRLQLNQVRVFVPMMAWQRDSATLNRNLIAFVRAAHARGIGVMPTMQYGRGIAMDTTAWERARPFVTDLVATLGKEPGLEVWDVMNEPECCALPPTPANRLRMRFAMYMARMFHQVDPVTPVTIGATFAENMITMGDAVDVLSFHNYSPTRAQIRAEIALAKSYADSVGKPLVNTEIGCVGRANPYDVALQEYMNAHVGWYIWELMISRQWGNEQGVFYPDGTVRDPSIVAAIMGFFRNRGPDVVPEVPDREGWVTRTVDGSKKWLADPNATWDRGLELAEISANLLEAAQLVAMHDLPTREVDLLRQGPPDMPRLRADLEKYTALLEPWRRPPRQR